MGSSLKEGNPNDSQPSENRILPVGCGTSHGEQCEQYPQDGAPMNEVQPSGEGHENKGLVVANTPARTVRVPDGGWGWMVVIGAGINSLLFGGLLHTIGIVYLQIREKYQVSAACAVWVGGLYQLFSGLGSPIAAWLVQKYSTRSVTIIGTIINCLGIFATSYAPNIYVVFITYGVVPGIGSCLLHTASYLHVGAYFEKKKARALALTSVNQGVGTLIFAPILVLLHNEYNLSGAFFILSAIVTHSFISAALFRPLTSRSNQRNYGGSKKKKGGGRGKEGRGHHSVDSSYKHVQRDQSTEPLCSDNLSSHSTHVICATCQTNTSTLTDVVNIQSDQPPSPVKVPVNVINDHSEYCQEHGFPLENRDSNRQNSQQERQLKSCHSGLNQGKGSAPVIVQEPPKKRFLAMFSSVISIEYIMLCLAFFSNLSSTATATQFTPALVLEKQLPMSQAATLVSISGFAFGAGTLILGSLLDIPMIRAYRLYVYSVCVFITGLSTMALPLGNTLITMAMPMAFGSAAAAVVYTQIVTVLTDLLGRDNVPAGFGLLRIAGAFGAITGRVVGGILVDVLGQNGLAFYIFGALPVTSSILLLLTLARWRQKTESGRLRAPV